MTTLVVGVALTLAAIALVLVVRNQLIDGVVEAAEVRAADIEGLIEGGALPNSVATNDEDDSLVQVIDQNGQVIAASENIDGEASLLDGLSSGTEVVRVPVGEHPFMVVRAQTESTDGTISVVSGQSLESVQEVTGLLAGSLLVGIPVLVLLVLYTTWQMTGAALAPVDGIRRRVDEVQAADPSQRVPVPGTGDEVARLASTMNEMLDRVETFQTRQRQFVSDASHELRSPIASIRQLTEVAIAHPEKNDDAFLADVQAESLRMQHLVDDLLLLARGSARPAPARLDTVDLDDLALAQIHRLRGTTSLRVDGTGIGTARTRGSSDQLDRAIRNIVDNAANHAATTVAIATFAEHHDVSILRVDDDGQGIPEADRHRVFERFVRLDAARSRDEGGSGLGLAIVQEIITAHGGEITIGSSPLGGARVEIALPWFE
ncbi:sensor histidine kinase [Euzebya tangerina]|uniref:sensor histidine kinase n=1 Tax=Euzebya tangerina TaxID=591198 RepID=UPI00196A4111|nr:ATP-binding protein [Euzebya tangerina]